jgi:hypothetical protein
MALELRPRSTGENGHLCRVPRPRHLEVAQGHVCECGKRWSYQPAHWELVSTLEELRRRQEAGPLLLGIIPRFRADIETDHEGGIGTVLPLRTPRTMPFERPASSG